VKTTNILQVTDKLSHNCVWSTHCHVWRCR